MTQQKNEHKAISHD